MIFQLENGGNVDLVDHTNSILQQYPDAMIYIGCDSQNRRFNCVYATVVAYRFTYEGTRWGARYVFQKEHVDKVKDKYTRLWGEVTRSTELAVWLESKGFKVYQIDLDFNEKITAGSHDMVASGTGYVKGLGFQVSIKPETQCATRCADHIVKLKTKYRGRRGYGGGKQRRLRVA